MKTHTWEIIRQAVERYFALQSYRKAALLSNVGKSTIQRWVCNIGRQIVRKKYTRRTSIFKCLLEQLPKVLKSTPCTSLHKIKSELSVQCSLSWISTALKALKVKRIRRSFKVFHGNRDKTREKIQIFKYLVENISLDTIISLDETGFCNVGNDFYGYGDAFKNVEIHSPKRFKKTCIMAATTTGILCYQLQTDCARKSSFIDFIMKLTHNLDIKYKYVVMDNISFHHSQEVKSLLHDKGLSIIYCPPYSPRFNPIEQVFSILKSKFRECIICEPSLGQMRFDEITNQVIQETMQHHTNFERMFNHCIHSE